MKNYQQTVGGIFEKIVSLSGLIEKYTLRFEITLPCLLVAALLVAPAGQSVINAILREDPPRPCLCGD
jgi:hypothetical protein